MPVVGSTDKSIPKKQIFYNNSPAGLVLTSEMLHANEVSSHLLTTSGGAFEVSQIKCVFKSSFQRNFCLSDHLLMVLMASEMTRGMKYMVVARGTLQQQPEKVNTFTALITIMLLCYYCCFCESLRNLQ